ncbi:MAG TPA: nitroreductase/quinone reductase family protein [Streptosporangiaceae bacterium]|jgi:deazaflavin-dependent oxidoreductase (nitroreductase family)|nr:nitroreductase/quinone reductase family protein [Streptosporangiaceae bacterium]
MTESEDVRKRDAETIAQFRANHGKVGGELAGIPLLLLHTVGRSTGTPQVHPLSYLPRHGSYVVFASKGGGDDVPSWYHDLMARREARIEVGDEVVSVSARELEGQEKEDSYAEQARLFPVFNDYQRATTRDIPVIALTPISEQRSTP